jgi:hypothetical protein
VSSAVTGGADTWWGRYRSLASGSVGECASAPARRSPGGRGSGEGTPAPALPGPPGGRGRRAVRLGRPPPWGPANHQMTRRSGRFHQCAERRTAMAPAYASRRSPEGRLPSSGRVVLGRGSVTREIAAGSAVVVLDATTGDIRLSLSTSRIQVHHLPRQRACKSRSASSVRIRRLLSIS